MYFLKCGRIWTIQKEGIKVINYFVTWNTLEASQPEGAGEGGEVSISFHLLLDFTLFKF